MWEHYRKHKLNNAHQLFNNNYDRREQQKERKDLEEQKYVNKRDLKFMSKSDKLDTTDFYEVARFGPSPFGNQGRIPSLAPPSIGIGSPNPFISRAAKFLQLRSGEVASKCGIIKIDDFPCL